jgi:DNA-binding CsgD family transcriptional regulator
MTNQATASYLGIGERTVRQHLMNTYAKMGVTSRMEAVSKALREGWIDLDSG